MIKKLTPGREIRFVEGFVPYSRCKGDNGTLAGWANIIEIAVLPTGWVQVEHDDNTTMLYSQHVVASLKNPLFLEGQHRRAGHEEAHS